LLWLKCLFRLSQPPPHDQLGYFVQNSINADPTDLVRSLREDKTLPFQDIISAESSHLTVGPPPPKVCCFGLQAIVSLDEGGSKNWATVPVILISLMIGALMSIFFGRRLWKRRAYLDVDDMACEMKTSEFGNYTMTDEDIAREKASHRFDMGESNTVEGDGSTFKKKHSKKKLKDNCGSSDRTSSLRSLDLTDDESSLRKQKKKKNNKIDASDSSGQSGGSIEGSLDEIDAALAKVSKKHSRKKLDGSNRSGASSNSGTSSLDQDKYQYETEEERRKRRKKEKKVKKKAERLSARSLEELRVEKLSSRKMVVRFEDDVSSR
jgi:hypothetical protein